MCKKLVHLQHCPMFAEKAGAYPSEAFSGHPFKDRLLALTTNIRLGLKGVQWTNTLAYCKPLSFADVKVI